MKRIIQVLAPFALTAALLGVAQAQTPAKVDLSKLTWLAGTRYIARPDGSKSYETWTGPTMGVISGAVASGNGGMSEFFRIGPNEKGEYGMTSTNTNVGLTTWKFRPLQTITDRKLVFGDATGTFGIEPAANGAVHTYATRITNGKSEPSGDWMWLPMPIEGAK